MLGTDPADGAGVGELVELPCKSHPDPGGDRCRIDSGGIEHRLEPLGMVLHLRDDVAREKRRGADRIYIEVDETLDLLPEGQVRGKNAEDGGKQPAGALPENRRREAFL